jgi:hypothetical protein
MEPKESDTQKAGAILSFQNLQAQRCVAIPEDYQKRLLPQRKHTELNFTRVREMT